MTDGLPAPDCARMPPKSVSADTSVRLSGLAQTLSEAVGQVVVEEEPHVEVRRG